jgi:succinyl-CoA synthetase beta subunit
MKLFEYQAKDIFKDSGIPVPFSVLIRSPQEAQAAIEAVGLPCVLKCQVLSGGRGKAGLVKLVKEKEEAMQAAKEYFERVKNLHAVLVETAVDSAREIYLSIGMDPVSGEALLMGCAQGGVEIEHLAVNNPDAIIKASIDLDKGLQTYQISDFAYTLGLRDEELKKASGVISALYKVFIQTDAELAEINPLFVRADGELFAGDAKLSIDDNSMFRQKAYEKDRSYYESDMAYEAAKEGIPYIEFDGDISLMCAGAGLANTVYDLVNFEGGKVANYLEFGGPNYMKAGTAMRLCLANKPKVVLIVTFGTIARADIMAEGIVQAMKDLQPDCPIIACLRGTGEEKVEEIFSSVGLQCYTDTEEAVRTAVALSKVGGMA